MTSKTKKYLLTAVLISIALVFSIKVYRQATSTRTIPLNTKKLAVKLAKKSINPNILKTPTLDEIFDDKIKDLSSLTRQKLVTLIATGDVIPARSVNLKMHQYNNFKYPFEKTADILSSADITLINLEAPLVKDCPITNAGMIFCGDPQFIKGLLFAGIDVANLANNHIGNHGQTGIEQTQTLLNENEILISGLDGISYKRVGETPFAFLGYNGVKPEVDGVNWINKEQIAKDIQEAKLNADIIVVSFHWGKEYSAKPVTDPAIAPFDPQEIAHLAVDSGADLIIGNHPHWIQGVEIYKEKLIVYAHGNFIFDQMWSQKTREGVIGKYVFYENKLIDFAFIPVVINDYAQPELLNGEDKDRILEYIKSMSNNTL